MMVRVDLWASGVRSLLFAGMILIVSLHAIPFSFSPSPDGKFASNSPEILPPPHSTLVAEISSVNTTWVGPEPICAGGPGELVTSFVGNASGGSPPYQFQWAFGDGSPVSTEQDPTHVYSWNVSAYTVTLTVTDSQGSTGAVGAIVVEPGYYCPPNPLPPALPSFVGVPALAIPTVVVGLGAGIGVTVRTLRREPPGTGRT